MHCHEWIPRELFARGAILVIDIHLVTKSTQEEVGSFLREGACSTNIRKGNLKQEVPAEQRKATLGADPQDWDPVSFRDSSTMPEVVDDLFTQRNFIFLRHQK